MEKDFTQPVLQPIRPNLWKLIHPWRFRCWIVAAGFETDLDSVPRLPGFYIMLKNRTVAGAVIHDFLLKQGYPRAFCDRVFVDAMRAEGVPFYYRWPIYWGVAAFSWLRNRKKKTENPA